jgi:hypothetical protein
LTLKFVSAPADIQCMNSRALALPALAAMAVMPSAAHAQANVAPISSVPRADSAQLQAAITRDSRTLRRLRALYKARPSTAAASRIRLLQNRIAAASVQLRSANALVTGQAATNVVVTLSTPKMNTRLTKLGLGQCIGACAGCACGATPIPAPVQTNAVVGRKEGE